MSPRFDPNRRRWLKALTAGAGASVLAACGDAFDPSTLPFGLGVASGDATGDGALLWTRYGGSRALELRVWEGEPDGLEVDRREVVPSDAGVVRQEISGLRAFTWHSFRFTEDGGEASPIGRFRTAPAADFREPLRLAATSCTRYGNPMTVLEQMGQRADLDLLLLLGDAVYADGALTVDQYRYKWARTLGERGPQAMRQATSLLATWDDHEFVNDWARETLTPPEKFENASRAFFDHMPMRRLADAPERLYRSVRWGKTVELFVLDSRGERKPSTRLTDQAEYLSNTQLSWLQQGLAESPCDFKLILNSVPISAFAGSLFQTTVHDRWEGYPAQRTRVLSFIDELRIPGVLWVSGDFHLGSMGRTSFEGPGASQVEVLVGPGANFSNPSPSYPAPPQFDWSSGINNYAVLDLDPSSGGVTVRYHDARDRVLVEKRYQLR